MKTTLPETITDANLDSILLLLNCKEPLSKEMLKIKLENLILFDNKQRDYGPRNISGFGTLGVIVRMNDKFERLKNLLGQKRRKPRNESFQDSLKDISNYADIGILLERGIWPK